LEHRCCGTPKSIQPAIRLKLAVLRTAYADLGSCTIDDAGSMEMQFPKDWKIWLRVRESIADLAQQVVHIERLVNDSRDAGLACLGVRLFVTKCRDQDRRREIAVLGPAFDDTQTEDSGHANVGDDEIKSVLFGTFRSVTQVIAKLGEQLGSVAALGDLISLLPQSQGKNGTHFIGILGEQNPCRGVLAITRR
jgi:hypothetical protein